MVGNVKNADINKIGVTKWYRQHADGNIVWQRDFFERIIRTDIELENVRNYIDRNPIVGVQYFEPHTTVNGPQSSKYIQSRGTP